MYHVVLQALKEWNKSGDRHTKLQHVYAVGAIVMVVVAGLIGLFNYDLGQFLLTVSFALAAIFFVNVIAWALVNAFLIDRLSRRSSKR